MTHLIIVDGSDYSGKTTLVKSLYKKYKLNNDIFLNSEPYNEDIIKSNNLKLFKFIKPYLDKRKIYSDKIRQDNYKMADLYDLFLKDRLYNYKMLYELKQHYSDILIIQDRSFISTLVYQQIFNHINIETLLSDHHKLIDRFNKKADIRPDTIIYCSADIKTILLRSQRIVNNKLDKLFINSIHKISDKYNEVINNIDKNRNLYRVKNKTKIIKYHQSFNNPIDINKFLKNKFI